MWARKIEGRWSSISGLQEFATASEVELDMNYFEILLCFSIPDANVCSGWDIGTKHLKRNLWRAHIESLVFCKLWYHRLNVTFMSCSNRSKSDEYACHHVSNPLHQKFKSQYKEQKQH